jgi:thioesterase domain-containing protein
MAAHYIKEIRELQPEGPYALCGSSFGGLVAYEIAQQLRVQGEEVALLAMFDTYAPGYPTHLPATTAFRRKLYAWRSRWELHWQNLMAAEWDGKVEYVRTKLGRLGRRLQIGMKRKSDGLRDQFRQRLVPRPLRVVREAGRWAAKDYRPKPYPGTITLFRATKQPYGIYPDRTNGWGPLAIGGVVVHDSPGHHGAIIREPRTRVLAQRLNQCLRRAQENGRGQVKSTLRETSLD